MTWSNLVNIGLSNDLPFKGTKPLPEPLSTGLQRAHQIEISHEMVMIKKKLNVFRNETFDGYICLMAAHTS